MMLVGLCACGSKTDNKSSESSAPESSAADNTVAAFNSDASTEETSAASGPAASQAKLDQKLNFIKLDDRDPSVLKGVSVYGNRTGSSEFNSKDPSTEGIRCVFELNEWVGFDLDTAKTAGITVWVLKHNDDQKLYETAEFTDQMAGFAQFCELKQDTENPENKSWGEFYLNPESCGAGYYDFVFVYDGKAIATLLTKFYNEGELSDKTDAELTKLMTE